MTEDSTQLIYEYSCHEGTTAWPTSSPRAGSSTRRSRKGGDGHVRPARNDDDSDRAPSPRARQTCFPGGRDVQHHADSNSSTARRRGRPDRDVVRRARGTDCAGQTSCRQPSRNGHGQGLHRRARPEELDAAEDAVGRPGHLGGVHQERRGEHAVRAPGRMGGPDDGRHHAGGARRRHHAATGGGAQHGAARGAHSLVRQSGRQEQAPVVRDRSA